ncbi:O-antigen polymerase [Argonema galeatum]|uniref:O-antigen polymerase n=1 Tax=Argonema galeatum TaxID=2942762 RepID=UPI002011075C|nr:O-antigen polymerase [Argonema galeatum]MCL1467423.1 oligosaccharide repeat unit polymerase [Argonema galeatum A003/A1]
MPIEQNMLAMTYIALIGFILFLEIFRKKETLFDFLSWFNVIFCLSYPFPAFLLEANFNHKTIELMYDSRTIYTSDLQTTVAIFMGYLCVIVGFYAKSATKYAKYFSIQQNKDWKIILYAIGLLLFACLSIQIYGSQYGGVLVALTQTNLIRAGVVESGPLVFFKQFIFTSFFASYLLASILFIRKYKTLRIILLVIFAFSVVVAFVAATLSSGRIPLINYFLGFYLVSVVYSGKLSLGITIPAIVGVFLFILYGKVLFFSLTAIPRGLDAVIDTFTQAIQNDTSSGGGLYSFMSNFVYPVHSLDSAFKEVYEPRFFVDWIYGLLSLIPSRVLNGVLGIDLPPSAADWNSEFVLGVRTTTVPPGVLAFGIYSMSWLGLILFCFVYGWVGRYLQSILIRYIKDIYWMPFLYVLTLQVWTDFTPTGDPRIYLINYFWFLLSSTILLLGIGKISLIKSPKNQTSQPG